MEKIVVPWSGDLSLENSKEIVRTLWSVIKGLPCVFVETIQGEVAPSLIIPSLWLADVTIREMEKREGYENGFDGLSVRTSKWVFEYPKYGLNGIRLTTQVKIHEKGLSFTFWNTDSKRTIHTYTIQM